MRLTLVAPLQLHMLFIGDSTAVRQNTRATAVLVKLDSMFIGILVS